MSARPWHALGLGSFALCLLLVKADGPIGRAKLSDELPVVIKLQLSKSEVTPEEKVRLEELVPVELDVEIDRTISHHVLEVAYYDKQNARLVGRLDPGLYKTIHCQLGFDELPRGLGASHPIPFQIRDGRHKGVCFEFQPRRLGVFLITATWWLREGGLVTSQPAILVVKPPLDDKGRPIVRPEWLREIPSIIEIVEEIKDK